MVSIDILTNRVFIYLLGQKALINKNNPPVFYYSDSFVYGVLVWALRNVSVMQSYVSFTFGDANAPWTKKLIMNHCKPLNIISLSIFY